MTPRIGDRPGDILNPFFAPEGAADIHMDALLDRGPEGSTRRGIHMRRSAIRVGVLLVALTTMFGAAGIARAGSTTTSGNDNSGDTSLPAWSRACRHPG